MAWIKTITVVLCFFCIPWKAYSFSYEKRVSEESIPIHILIVDPKEHSIFPVRAEGGMVSRETVATLSKRYEASAGVNGGFWKTNGTPAGVLKIGPIWEGTPHKPRGAIGWSFQNSKVLIDRILTNYSLTNLPEGEVIEVLPQTSSTSSLDWADLDYIVGGAPVLIDHGEIIQDFSSEQTLASFLDKRHPRTAVGIKENGEWVFVVVDSCPFYICGGMTIKELALFMRELGCVFALNLDGGGSSTMVIDGVVVNNPCGALKEHGKRVEAVSDAILIH